MNTHARDFSAAAGRVLVAALFLISGVGKMAAPAATKAYIAAAGLPAPDAGYVLALVVEVGFALALIAGFRTRVVALLMAAFTLVTALFFHAHFADQNQAIHFLKNVAIAGGLLQVVAFGGGAFSADAILGRHRKLAAVP